MKPLYQHIITGICAIIVIAYMVFGIRMSRHAVPQPKCQHMQVRILDDEQRQYVTSIELAQLIQSKGLNPVGKLRNAIQLQPIEKMVYQHDMVRSAECYRTMEGDVVVDITQRVPLLHVVTEAENYFVDTDLKIMPPRASVNTPVLVATGHVSKRMASNEISQFARWLQQNAFWQSRIQRVEVKSPKMVHLIQRESRAEIILGDWQDYERKLNKLRHWYEADTALHQNQYPQVDLRFRNQVIGIKNSTR